MTDEADKGGEMAARIRALDWSRTPLGPMAQWPQSLRIATRLLLSTRHPMLIFWGPALIQIYNDAYRATMGPEKHPSALGRPGRETWAEIWDVIGPEIDQVMSGGAATWHEDQLVPVTRHGDRREVWWTYSFSPIDDEDAVNGVGGVLVITRDVTSEHVARQMAQDNEARYRGLFETMEEGYLVADVIFDGAGRAVDIEYFEANPAATRMVGTDVTGRRLREVDPAYEDYWYETFGRVAVTGRSERALLYAKPGDIWYDFHVSKIRPGDPNSRRIAVLFFDATARVRAESARQVLVAELQHRTRNLLSVISGIADRTRSTSDTLDEFGARYDRRLAALGRVQGILSSSGVPGIALDELLMLELEAHGVDPSHPCISIAGPPVALSPDTVQLLALALHELATNALKHGALRAEGRLEIRWSVRTREDGMRLLALTWLERGVPMPDGEPRRGFGREMIETNLPYELDATTRLTFGPDGVCCFIEVVLP